MKNLNNKLKLLFDINTYKYLMLPTILYTWVTPY